MRAPNLEVLAASEICATSFEEGLALFMPASWLGWEEFIGGSCSLGRMLSFSAKANIAANARREITDGITLFIALNWGRVVFKLMYGS